MNRFIFMSVLLCSALVLLSVAFVWHTELFMWGKEVQERFGVEPVFTNGYVTDSPEKVYHNFMYLMFFVIFMVIVWVSYLTSLVVHK